MYEIKNRKDAQVLRGQLALYGLPRAGSDLTVKKTKVDWIRKNDNVYTEISDYGTFRDSLRAPIHRWFKYPAGYSYKFVEAKIRQYHLKRRDCILDPFVGCGTTCIEAKRHGVDSIGIEAHQFIHWVANVKLNWQIDLFEIGSYFQKVMEYARNSIGSTYANELPELVHKCYSPQNLTSLLAIRDAIRHVVISEPIQGFLNLALTDTLRNASKAATGWPYISPSKLHERIHEKEAFAEFQSQVSRMLEDLEFIQMYYCNTDADVTLIYGDSREPHDCIEEGSIDLALTSPPYLNNYDYADRTRLETYFFGWYRSWGEITENVRDHLMMSATTQVRREEFSEGGGISENLKNADPKFYTELLEKVNRLSEIRMNKGGRKSYDCLVAGYFNDMFLVLKQVCRVLKSGSDFVLVLGDSAPYGVYIPTHEYLARLALAVGFSSWKVEELRKRGDKWRENPQRHNVKLKEVILTLRK